MLYIYIGSPTKFNNFVIIYDYMLSQSRVFVNSMTKTYFAYGICNIGLDSHVR